MKVSSLLVGIICFVSSITGLSNSALAAWQAIAPMPTATYSHGSAALGGNVYLVGGAVGSGALDTARRFDPSTGTYSSLAALPASRRWLRLVVVNDTLYALGGSPDPVASGRTWKYNVGSDTWTEVASMGTARSNFAGAATGGKIYVFGGDDNGWRISNAEVYDPVADTWSSIAGVPAPIYRTASSAIAYGGKVYIFGGNGGAGQTSGDYIDEVLQYDPVTDTYSVVSTIPTPVCNHTAALNGSKVYVCGGSTAGGTTNAVQVYDLDADTWSVESSMINKRGEFGGAICAGALYAFGGSGTAIMADAEKLDLVPPDDYYHPADSDQDWRMEIDEVTAYGAAWKTGQHNNINYTTRGGYLWKNGEAYHDTGTGPLDPDNDASRWVLGE